MRLTLHSTVRFLVFFAHTGLIGNVSNGRKQPSFDPQSGYRLFDLGPQQVGERRNDPEALSRGRRLGPAGSERALDHHRIRPAAELVADGGQIADLAEAEGLVQPESRRGWRRR